MKLNNSSQTVVLWSNDHTLSHLTIDVNNQTSPSLIHHINGLKEDFGCVNLPCDLIPLGKFRNGANKSWCCLHQSPYGKKADLEKGYCMNAKKPLNYVRNPKTIHPEDYSKGLALWPSLPPFWTNSSEYRFIPSANGTHAHVWKNGKKIIDKTYKVLRVPLLGPLGLCCDKDIVLTPPSVEAFFSANASNTKLVAIKCSGCHEYHTDLKWFSQNPHSKHQCGKCGKEFFSKESCVSNALVSLAEYESRHRQYIDAVGKKNISEYNDKNKYDIFAWPTSEPLLWTVDKPVVRNGVHLHVIDKESNQKLIDDTFNYVIIDNIQLDCQYLMEIYNRFGTETLNHENIYMRKSKKDDVNTEKARRFIYFISDGNAVKVGQSSDIDSRIQSLQTGNSRPLEYVHHVEVSVNEATTKEKAIHQILEKYSSHGEWFILPLDVLSFIKTLSSINEIECFLPIFLSNHY